MEDTNGTVNLRSVQRFLEKPSREKLNSVHKLWTRAVSKFAFPVRLPFGVWWIPRRDNVGGPLLSGSFEPSELTFTGRFLRSGMNVLDLGAHHGLYTLLCSKRVGSHGKVFSFEPSARERRALRAHVWLNLCTNVTIQGLALGSEDKNAELFVVSGSQTGCNSLRPPDVLSETWTQRVRVTRLDFWLERHRVEQVDFMKLDVEGAELDVLRGAEQLLTRRPRPVILAEVQDVRTKPWGYRAKEIIMYLSARGFRWFGLSENGFLEEIDEDLEELDGNFVAWPKEVTIPLQEKTCLLPKQLRNHGPKGG